MKKLFIALIIFIFGTFGVLNPVRDAFQFIFAPIQFGLKNVALGLKGSIDFFYNLKRLRDENIALLQENNDLTSVILELKKAEEDNELLKDQLNLKNKESFDKEFVMASVMGNPNDLTGGTIIIDKGLRHGIKIGANVIEGNYLVGIVKEVYTERSLVSLITSPSVSATVRDIDVAQKTEGLVTGKYGTSIQMTRILPNEEINVGDSIITSGKDGFFEPGLLVGKVVQVVEVPAEPLKSAYLETIVDTSKLHKVFVILN